MTVTVVPGKLQKLTSDASYKYVVVSQFTFTDTDCENRGSSSDAPTTRGRRGSAHFHVRVPVGFLTDGTPWLFHDWLYAKHEFTSGQPCTRAMADKVVEKVLRHDRLNFYAWGFTKLAKLNPFRGFSRSWKKSGTRGPEFLSPHEEPKGRV